MTRTTWQAALAWAAISAFAALLGSCGDMGGQQARSDDKSRPVLSFATKSPVDVDESITVSANEGLAAGSGIRVMLGDRGQVPGTVTFSGDRRSVTWTPAARMKHGQKLMVIGVGQGASGNTAGIAQVFYTVDPPGTQAWWPPAVVAPVDTAVFDPKPLPAGCRSWRDACWHDAVREGVVKFVGFAGPQQAPARPILYAYFRTVATDGVTPLWSVIPLYADDGSPVFADIWDGSPWEIDSVAATRNGLVYHRNDTGLCVGLQIAGNVPIPRTVACA